MELKILSWNIAGGDKVTNKDIKNSKEDIPYFAKTIREYDADIVCLQETHINSSRSTSKEIADLAGYQYVYEESISPSHNSPDYQLGLAILSHEVITSKKLIRYTNPNLERIVVSNGRKFTSHDKAAQIINFHGIDILNTQLLPMHVFFIDYDKDQGKEIFANITNQIINNIKSPAILCGDFNYDFDNPEELLLKSLNLRCVLPEDKRTLIHESSSNTHPDHIFVSHQFTCNTSEVVETESDHYLCYCELKTTNLL